MTTARSSSPNSAALDIARGARRRATTPVAAQGPFGTLTAEGFRLSDRGQVVVFTGNARAVLEGRTSDAPLRSLLAALLLAAVPRSARAST